MKRLTVTTVAIAWLVITAASFGASAQTVKAKTKATSAQGIEAEAEPEASQKLADLEAAQSDLERQVESLKQQLNAERQDKADRETIDALEKKVDELDAQLSAQAEESKAADTVMKKEIDALAPVKGFTIKGPGESHLTIGGLLQARLEGTEKAAPNADSWDFDTYLRRMRLLVYGQLNKWVNFFIETDNPNFGKSSDWSPSTFIQDAYLELNLHEAFQLDIGMLLLPFSHHGMQGATSLLGMDYHTTLIRYPAGGTKVWRDAGAMIRGLLAGQHIEYRFGLFNGVHGGAKLSSDPAEERTDPRNPKDWPRLTGRLTFNVFDAEGGAGAGGFFYDGLYLGATPDGVVSTKKVLSFGASVDWQKDLNVEIRDPSSRALPTDSYIVEGRDDYVAASWDAFWDIPLGAAKLWSLNGQIDAYYYNFGDRSPHLDDAGDATSFWYYDAVADKTSHTGLGLFTELGFRYSRFQPVFLLDWYHPTKSPDVDDNLGVAGGLNVYLFSHSTTLKLQAGADRAAKQDGHDDWRASIKFQAQLLF